MEFNDRACVLHTRVRDESRKQIVIQLMKAKSK